MESFDVFDESGKPTGEIKSRSLVHRDGDWHKAVHVWIVNDQGRLLMQKRSPDKDSHPGEWDISCAGHVVAGETSISTALKEMEEELGLKFSESDFQFLFHLTNQSVQKNGTFINNEFDDVYLVRQNLEISKLKLKVEEVSGVKWISIDELDEVVKNKTQGYVGHTEEYARIINYLRK